MAGVSLGSATTGFVFIVTLAAISSSCHDGKDYAYVPGSLDAHWRRLGDLM